MSKDILFSPSGDTSFAKGEPLFAYFEVYEPQLAENPAAPVSVHMRILDSKTGNTKEDFAPIDAASYKQAGSSVLRIGRKIPIDQLPKGSYRLEMQATGSMGRSTAWRTANFTVQ